LAIQFNISGGERLGPSYQPFSFAFLCAFAVTNEERALEAGEA
jgi:hypothetical protein